MLRVRKRSLYLHRVMSRYNQYRSRRFAQPEPKARIGTFYRRIREGKSLEEAIKYKAPNWNFKPFRPIISNPTRMQPEENRSRFLIEVTMKPEEAEVFHRYYRRLIEEEENKIHEVEDLSNRKTYEADLNKLIEEYEVFKSYNPIP